MTGHHAILICHSLVAIMHPLAVAYERAEQWIENNTHVNECTISYCAKIWTFSINFNRATLHVSLSLRSWDGNAVVISFRSKCQTFFIFYPKKNLLAVSIHCGGNAAEWFKDSIYYSRLFRWANQIPKYWGENRSFDGNHIRSSPENFVECNGCVWVR